MVAIASRPHSVVVLGAGLYGRRVAAELLLLLSPKHRLGLANRNERALQEAAQDICAIASEAAAAGSSVTAPAAPRFDTSAVAMIGGCDATDPDDMRCLAESTAVLIACLPNYRAVGDTIVRACAAAGTCYFDLSVETDLHAMWRRLHGAAAEASGTIICPSVGYDYTVADFGTEEARQLLPDVKSVTCLMSVRAPGGMVLREGTFLDILDRMGHPTLPAADAPVASSHAPPSAGGRRHWPVEWAGVAGGWSVPGPQSEADVVNASQVHLTTCRSLAGGSAAVRRLQYTPRLVLPSLVMVFAAAVGILLLQLARLAPVRRLLRLLAPVLRQAGVLTRDNERYLTSMRQATIRKQFVVENAAGERRVLDVNASGYRVTPTAAALAAATVLQQRDRCCAGGVTTPAGAFHRTDYWDRLKDRAGITLAVSEPEAQRRWALGWLGARAPSSKQE